MQWLNKLEEATRIKGLPGYEREWAEDVSPLYGVDVKGLEEGTRITFLPGSDREWTEGVSPLTGVDTEGMNEVYVAPIEEAVAAVEEKVEEAAAAVEEKVEGVSMTQTVAGLIVLAGAIAVLTVGLAKQTPQAKAAGKVKEVISDAAD